MKRAVDFPEISPVEMSVDRGGRDRRVTEQLLHHAQVGSSLQQMGGERMPQRVGMDPDRERGGTRVPAQDLPEAHAAQRATAGVGEHAVMARACAQPRSRPLQVDLERLPRGAPERCSW